MTSLLPLTMKRRHTHCSSNKVKLITCSASISIHCEVRRRGYTFLSMRKLFKHFCSPFFLNNSIEIYPERYRNSYIAFIIMDCMLLACLQQRRTRFHTLPIISLLTSYIKGKGDITSIVSLAALVRL